MSLAVDLSQSDPIPESKQQNWFTTDAYLQWILRGLVDANTWEVASTALTELGALASTTLDALATTAEAHPPVLHTHDARGLPNDRIEFHPAYTELEDTILRFGVLHAAYNPGWRGLTKRAPRTLIAALQYLILQADQAIMGCPIGMSDGMARCLELNDPELATQYVPKLSDDTGSPLRGAMFLTERFGGSDVGANQTVAHHESGIEWKLTGEKWFSSCPHSDLILVTARPEGAPSGTKGLGLFLVPRHREDGSRNAYTIRRLKDKFGTRAMPSGEVELEGATAWQVGKLDQGMRQMLDMINHSRMCIVVVAAATMRRNVREALNHSTERKTFGTTLLHHPLMLDTLLDMEVDATAGAAAAFVLADLTDRTDAGDTAASHRLRLLTPIYKGYATERARITAIEGMEVRGGNGVINEWPEARILRDITVHAIWEGSSNIVALDALRAVHKTPDALALLRGTPNDPPDHPLFEALQQLIGEAGKEVHTAIHVLLSATPGEQELGIRRIARQYAIFSLAMVLESQSHTQYRETHALNLALIALRLLSRTWEMSVATRFLAAPFWIQVGQSLLNQIPITDGDVVVDAVVAMVKANAVMMDAL